MVRTAELLDDGEPAIVFTLTKREAQDVAAGLRARGLLADCYHGDMSSTQRRVVQRRWSAGELAVVCATVAFGMGIDKANVRNIVHFSAPASLSTFMQQARLAPRSSRSHHCSDPAALPAFQRPPMPPPMPPPASPRGRKRGAHSTAHLPLARAHRPVAPAATVCPLSARCCIPQQTSREPHTSPAVASRRAGGVGAHRRCKRAPPAGHPPPPSSGLPRPPAAHATRARSRARTCTVWAPRGSAQRAVHRAAARAAARLWRLDQRPRALHRRRRAAGRRRANRRCCRAGLLHHVGVPTAGAVGAGRRGLRRVALQRTAAVQLPARLGTATPALSAYRRAVQVAVASSAHAQAAPGASGRPRRLQRWRQRQGAWR